MSPNIAGRSLYLVPGQTLSLKLDVYRVVAMLLVHDIGEIDAGDKFASHKTAGRSARQQSFEPSSGSALRPLVLANSSSLSGRNSMLEKLRKRSLRRRSIEACQFC
jgi:hypothetical protein